MYDESMGTEGEQKPAADESITEVGVTLTPSSHYMQSYHQHCEWWMQVEPEEVKEKAIVVLNRSELKLHMLFNEFTEIPREVSLHTHREL